MNFKIVFFACLFLPFLSFAQYSNQNLFKLNGDLIKRDSLIKGTALNFWFIGCYPCMKEIPELNKIADEYKDRITFIAVSKDNTKAQVEYFIKKFPFSFTHALPNKELLEHLKIELYPTNILYNNKGEIIYRSEGYDENTIFSLRKAIEELIKNP